MYEVCWSYTTPNMSFFLWLHYVTLAKSTANQLIFSVAHPQNFWYCAINVYHIFARQSYIRMDNMKGTVHLSVQQPFYGTLSGTTRVKRYQKKTFTQSHLSWSSIILYQLPTSMIHSILPVQFAFLRVFAQPLSKSSGLLLVWNPPLHTPCSFSPNHCLLFATHAYTIETCFAVVSRLFHLFLVSL